jgi:cytochrome c-type biogenesis protein
MDQLNVSMAHAAVAGLVSFLSPCVLPLALPYLAWIGAISLGEASAPPFIPSSRTAAVVRVASFVAGFVVMFIVFGITATAVAGWLGDWRRAATVIAGAVLVVLGLHVARIIRIRGLDMEARIIHQVTRPAGPLGAFVVGLAFAFGWSPCVGPILGAILTVAGTQDSLGRGAVLLGIYGLGMGAPFLLGAVLTRPFTRFAARTRACARSFELVAAGLIIVTGVLIISGRFSSVGLWMLETFPFFDRFG